MPKRSGLWNNFSEHFFGTTFSGSGGTFLGTNSLFYCILNKQIRRLLSRSHKNTNKIHFHLKFYFRPFTNERNAFRRRFLALVVLAPLPHHCLAWLSSAWLHAVFVDCKYDESLLQVVNVLGIQYSSNVVERWRRRRCQCSSSPKEADFFFVLASMLIEIAR